MCVVCVRLQFKRDDNVHDLKVLGSSSHNQNPEATELGFDSYSFGLMLTVDGKSFCCY